jgi:hypothetical protein
MTETITTWDRIVRASFTLSGWSIGLALLLVFIDSLFIMFAEPTSPLEQSVFFRGLVYMLMWSFMGCRFVLYIKSWQLMWPRPPSESQHIQLFWFSFWPLPRHLLDRGTSAIEHERKATCSLPPVAAFGRELPVEYSRKRFLSDCYW